MTQASTQRQDSTLTHHSTTQDRQALSAKARESGDLGIDSPIPGPSTPPQRHRHLGGSPLTIDQARRTRLPFSVDSYPRTPRKQLVQSSRSASPFGSPASHTTLNRAVNTALPHTPAHSISTPPSAFPSKLHDAIELHPLSPPRAGRDSPFDDRYSIFVDPAVDPFEYANVTVRRQRTVDGYQISTSSSSRTRVASRGMSPATSETLRGSEARKSLYSSGPSKANEVTLAPAPTTPSADETVPPTFRGLLAFHTPRDYVVYLFPAIVFSMVACLVQPYMSKTIGDAFDAFARYPLDGGVATAEDRAALQHGIKVTTIKLAATGGAAVVLNYIKGVLWARHAENVTHRLRHAVYKGVQCKGMEWYDLGMGMKVEGEEDNVGAGGLMGKFTR